MREKEKKQKKGRETEGKIKRSAGRRKREIGKKDNKDRER